MTLSTSLPVSGDDVWQKSQLLFAPPSYQVTVRRPRRRVYYLSYRGALSEPSNSLCKRAFDVVCAGLALVILSPLLLAVAVAIKATSRGPVLFTQYRYGRMNKRFRIFKFRTMHVQMSDKSGVTQTVGDDPRVTLVGRILRRTSIDELPQLINVLIGDMSLVGPRPHVPGMKAASVRYEDLVPYYFQRHNIRPGITGLAQVNGCRGSTALAAAAVSRVDYDLEYIECWSLWLDIKIILRTVRHEFFSGTGI